MIKKYWVYWLFGFAVILFAYTYFFNPKQHSQSNMIKLTCKTMQVQNGWGYEIFANDTLFIRQKNVPGIQGFKPFITENEAAKTANLVLHKLSHKLLPSINQKELDSLHITY